MANVATNLIHNSLDSSATSYATASYSPPANTLILASFTSRSNITVDPTQPTATGNGLTWVVVGSVVYDNTSTSRRRVTLFRAMGASPTTGALTFDEAGQTQTGGSWVIDQVTGTDTSGSDGSGAIVQAVTNFDGAGTATSLTVTLAAFSSANNSTYGSWGYGNPANAATAGSGFTIIGDDASIVNGARVTTEFQTANDTTVDISYAAGGEIGGIAIEIKASSAVTATFIPRRQLMGVG